MWPGNRLLFGEKNREERGGKGGSFSLSPVPRSTEGLFTGYRRCDLIRSRCVLTPLWLEVYKLGQKAQRRLRISKNFLQLFFFLEDFTAQYQGDLTEGLSFAWHFCF